MRSSSAFHIMLKLTPMRTRRLSSNVGHVGNNTCAPGGPPDHTGSCLGDEPESNMESPTKRSQDLKYERYSGAY